MSPWSLIPYAEVQLGPYQDIIRDMILRKDPGEPNVLSVALLQLTGYIGTQSMLGTKRAQRQPTVYNVGLPGFIAAIKVCKPVIPHPLQQQII